MEIHNIIAKGNFITESISTSAAWTSQDAGRIVYVIDEGKHYFGSTSDWIVLHEAGASGTSGSSGTSGIDGTSGSSGTSGIDGTSGSSGTSGGAAIDPSTLADQTAEGDMCTASIGTSAVIFDIFYRDTENVYLWADGAQDTTMPAVVMITESAAASGSYNLLTKGWVRDDSWSWVPGGLLYVDTILPGSMTQIEPSTPGEIIQIVGYAYTENIIFFNPQYKYDTVT